MGIPKPLLEWFGKTLVEAQIQSLVSAGSDDVIIVTGSQSDAVTRAVSPSERVSTVYNPNHLEGKTTSIKAGISALREDCTAIVLLAVDQPRPSWVIDQVLQSHLSSDALITSPRYRGHGGHPLVFNPALRAELGSISEEREGIREVMLRHQSEMNEVQFCSQVVRLDLNTPEDYHNALEIYPELGLEPER